MFPLYYLILRLPTGKILVTDTSWELGSPATCFNLDIQGVAPASRTVSIRLPPKEGFTDHSYGHPYVRECFGHIQTTGTKFRGVQVPDFHQHRRWWHK